MITEKLRGNMVKDKVLTKVVVYGVAQHVRICNWYPQLDEFLNVSEYLGSADGLNVFGHRATILYFDPAWS